jgi:plasmid maintenance system antidote protein VapI
MKASPSLGLLPPADRVRALLKELHWSQREAARQLEIDEREFRRMCAGARPIPNVVVLALVHAHQLMKGKTT